MSYYTFWFLNFSHSSKRWQWFPKQGFAVNHVIHIRRSVSSFTSTCVPKHRIGRRGVMTFSPSVLLQSNLQQGKMGKCLQIWWCMYSHQNQNKIPATKQQAVAKKPATPSNFESIRTSFDLRHIHPGSKVLSGDWHRILCFLLFLHLWLRWVIHNEHNRFHIGALVILQLVVWHLEFCLRKQPNQIPTVLICVSFTVLLGVFSKVLICVLKIQEPSTAKSPHQHLEDQRW